LDSDDVVTDGFLIRDNANALLRGLSLNATEALAVQAGGTGSATFTDGEFITYSSTLGKFKSSGISLPDTYSKAAMDSFFASKLASKYQIDYTNVVNAPSLQAFTQVAAIPTVNSTVLFSTMPWTFPDYWTVRLKCIATTVAHGWAVDDRLDLLAVYSSDGSADVVRHTSFLQADGAKIGVAWTNFTSFIVKKGGTILSMSNVNLAANFQFEATARKFTT